MLNLLISSMPSASFFLCFIDQNNACMPPVGLSPWLQLSFLLFFSFFFFFLMSPRFIHFISVEKICENQVHVGNVGEQIKKQWQSQRPLLGDYFLEDAQSIKAPCYFKTKKSRAYIPPSQFSVVKPTLAHTVSPSCSSVDNAHVLHHIPKRSASLLSSPLSFQSTDRAWGKSNSGLDTRQTL